MINMFLHLILSLETRDSLWWKCFCKRKHSRRIALSNS